MVIEEVATIGKMPSMPPLRVEDIQKGLLGTTDTHCAPETRPPATDANPVEGSAKTRWSCTPTLPANGQFACCRSPLGSLSSSFAGKAGSDADSRLAFTLRMFHFALTKHRCEASKKLLPESAVAQAEFDILERCARQNKRVMHYAFAPQTYSFVYVVNETPANQIFITGRKSAEGERSYSNITEITHTHQR